MKILLVGPGCGVPIPPKGWGGIEKVVWKYSVHLRKIGEEVDVYNGQNTKQFLDIIEKGKYDIIHINHEWAYNVLKPKGIPYVYTTHIASWNENWGHCNNILSTSRLAMACQTIYDRLICENKWMIPNGADPEFFYPEEKVKNKCLAVGHDESRKKFKEIANIVAKHKDFHLFIIGPKNEKNKIADNITVLPDLPEDDLAKHFRNSEYFIHLAVQETDALVVKEAAMSGCKLILSDYCAKCIGEDVSFQDKNNFFNCPEDFGEKAHKRVMETSTWDIIAKSLQEGYQSIL